MAVNILGMQLNFLNRRTLAIIGFVLLVVLFATSLYLLFFRSAPTPVTPEPTPTGPVTTLPTAGTGSPTTTPTGSTVGTTPQPTATPSQRANGGITVATPVINRTASHATVGPDGRSLLYYQPDDDVFYRITPEGTIETLTDTRFREVSNVTWSPNRQQAILEYPDGANIVYNFATKQQVTLPRHWEDFSFAPDGNQVVFKSMGLERESRWLGMTSLDGSSPTAIEPLGDKSPVVDVDWSPNRQVIATERQARGADRQDIYFVGLNGENFKSLPVPGTGFRSQWTPSGDQLLFSVASSSSGFKPSLWIVDAAGEAIGNNRRNLNVTTWVDKCTFATSTRLLCAVPESLPEGAGLSPAIADTIPDAIYDINITTGERRLLATPATPITVANLFVTSDGQWLFAQDQSSQNIFSIQL